MFRSDMSDGAVSVHHKVNDKTELGLSTACNLNTTNVAHSLVGKYTLSDEAVLKVREG